MPKAMLDEAKTAAFMARLVDVLNGGALSLMISIGHRTGLFDVMARLAPSSSDTIAARAGLSERYVREWLGALVTGGIVEYEPAARVYRLPPEHAAALARDARGANLAGTAQCISLLGAVEDEVVGCFERGDGIPHTSFERFQCAMAEERDRTVAPRLVEEVLPLVPGARSGLVTGIDVLDVGCGSGRALHMLAHSFPNSRFTGIDLSVEAIGRARQDAAAHRLPNLRLEVRDVADLSLTDAFDLVLAFGAIHEQARPAAALEAIARALRPDGVFLMQEVAGTSHLERDSGLALAPLLYTISCLHCVTVSLAADGAALGAMWGEEVARRMLGAAGFDAVEVHSLPRDAVHRYYVAGRTP
ncbi:MAG TPA: class I SAM-dependent methyltransferase [Myxococcota bacterium]|jgi:SAM-dependent methyltransferase|nr:class I SAM-dependent methyltransferase [Myxococcota bacterium]